MLAALKEIAEARHIVPAGVVVVGQDIARAALAELAKTQKAIADAVAKPAPETTHNRPLGDDGLPKPRTSRERMADRDE